MYSFINSNHKLITIKLYNLSQSQTFLFVKEECEI